MKRVIVFAVCVLALALPASAASEIADAFSVSEVEEAVPDSARDALGGNAETDFSKGAAEIAEYIMVNLKPEAESAFKPVGKILVIILISSVVSSVTGDAKGVDYVNLAAAVAVAVVSVSDVSSLIRMGSRTLEEMTDFSHVLLPVLAAAATAGGAFTSAGARYLASSIFLDFLMQLAGTVILPLIGAYTACTVASGAIGDKRLDSACSMMKWLCTFLLTTLVTVFTAYLSVSGIVASSADAVVSRAAKTAISTFVPVVGGIISSASGALIGGAGVIRSSIGVVGLLGVAGVCALPFLRLGVRYILFRAASAAAQTVSASRLGSLLAGISRVYGMILALVASEAAFLYISIISMIKAVSA